MSAGDSRTGGDLVPLRDYVELLVRGQAADHDAVIRLVTELKSLDRLLASYRAADAQAQVLFAKQLDDRLEKLNEFRGALADAQTHMIPRAETKLLIDALHARIDSVQTNLSTRVESLQVGIAGLQQSLTAVRATLAGQDRGADEAVEAATRTRNLIIGVAGVLAAVAAVLVAVFIH